MVEAVPRRRRSGALAGALLIASVGAGGAARGEPVAENEALVMRVIFDDCLGYVRDNRTPFAGLRTRPAPPAALRSLRSPPSGRVGTVELLSPRYIAHWGTSEGDRYCTINRADYGHTKAGSATLGVRRAGFVARVDARAARAGLTQRDGDELSPVSLLSWSQPGRDAPTGPGRPISFTIIPTAADERTGMVEIGTFAMGGPPLRRAGAGQR